MPKISKLLLGLTVIIGSFFTSFTEQALAVSFSYCESSAYSDQRSCNNNGYTWFYDCYCSDTSYGTYDFCISAGHTADWCKESPPTPTPTTTTPTPTTTTAPPTSTTTTPPASTTTTTPPSSTPTTTAPPSTTTTTIDQEAIRRQQEEEARKKAEEERLRKEAEERARKEAAASQLAASQKSQAEAKTDENRASVKNLGNLVHHRVMYVFAWRPNAVKSRIKTVKANQSTQIPPLKGMASGDTDMNYGLWITPASTWMKNKSTSSKYDGSLFTVMAGGDFKLTDNILIGVSAGYENMDLNTDYNDGSLKDNGFTIAPYFGYTITDSLIFDIMLGYTFLYNDMERNRSSECIKGSFDSHRFLISSNINYYAIFQNWNLSTVLGYMYVNENEDAYKEQGGYNFDVDSQNIYLSEWRFGGRAGYFINAFEPYISTAYLYDNAWNDGGNDRDELEGVLGCNYYPADRLILSLEATNSFFRDDIENTRITFNLHLDF